MINRDLKIIANLRNNARMSLTKLSKKTGIPISTIFDRLKVHEKNFIVRYTTLLDFGKIGYNIRANIIFKSEKSNRDDLKNYLMVHQNVNSVFRISSQFDFMVDAVFKSLIDLEEFTSHLEEKYNIENKQVHYIIEDIKREDFMSHPDLSPIIFRGNKID